MWHLILVHTVFKCLSVPELRFIKVIICFHKTQDLEIILMHALRCNCWSSAMKVGLLLPEFTTSYLPVWEWSDVLKVSCILRHRGILAYRWARPAILLAGKGGREMFLFVLFFFHIYSCSFFPVPLFHLYYLFYLFSPFLWETTQNNPQGLTCCQTPTQSICQY